MAAEIWVGLVTPEYNSVWDKNGGDCVCLCVFSWILDSKIVFTFGSKKSYRW